MTEQEAPRSKCGYCMGGELLDAFGIPICELSVSKLILFREQSHPGRCIVAYKDHVSEIVDISPEERAAFMEDIARAAKAIHAAFHPEKINYGAYGDTGCHLHVHLVPSIRKKSTTAPMGTPAAICMSTSCQSIGMVSSGAACSP